jgi:hypothetical protein
MRDLLNVLEKVSSGSNIEEFELEPDHRIIPSDETPHPKDNVKLYGRKFQKRYSNNNDLNF